MKTWLDAFVVELTNRYKNRTDLPFDRSSLLAHAHSVLYIGDVWDRSFEQAEESWLKDKDRFPPGEIDAYFSSTTLDERREAYNEMIALEKEWLAMMTPFLREGPHAPLALQVTPQLMALLAGKRVEAWDSETFELLEHHKSIYIDIPHNHFLIHSNLQIRAVIVRDMRYSAESYNDSDGKQQWRYVENDDSPIRVCVVLTQLKSDLEEGRVHWTLSSDERPSGFALNEKDVDTNVFKIEIEEFVKLILAYYLIAPIKSQEAVPQIDLSHADRKERRAWERDKRFSLFGVTQLSLTPNTQALELSAGLRGSRSGWKLGRRIHIEPFPRMQWKGKKGERYQEKVLVGEADGGYWKGPKNAPLKLKLFALS